MVGLLELGHHEMRALWRAEVRDLCAPATEGQGMLAVCGQGGIGTAILARCQRVHPRRGLASASVGVRVWSGDHLGDVGELV